MQLTRFLETSYTAYHAVDNSVTMLENAGFCRLKDNEKITRGGKYYVTRNGSTLLAFTAGENDIFNIAVCHTDSPSLKIKGDQKIPGQIDKLNVEKYGGGIMYTFFDRPLKIAGRLAVETKDGLRCVNTLSRFNVVIPSVAIHQNPSVNENFAVNVQTDMMPLFGKKNLYEALSPEEKVAAADLYVVSAEAPFYCGADNEFLCSPRIDNLTSVYACVKGISLCKPKNISVVCLFDSEETGSTTMQGAGSKFLPEMLERICDDLGLGEQSKRAAREKGFLLSADNAHAVHPAHPEKSDIRNNVALNGGIVIKYHVNYATDSLGAAVVKKLAEQAGIPYQNYYSRSDMRCGSTIGLIAATTLGMHACDIGLAQLAMHSAAETVGALDLKTAEEFLKVFLSARIECGEETKIEL